MDTKIHYHGLSSNEGIELSHVLLEDLDDEEDLKETLSINRLVEIDWIITNENLPWWNFWMIETNKIFDYIRVNIARS